MNMLVCILKDLIKKVNSELIQKLGLKSVEIFESNCRLPRAAVCSEFEPTVTEMRTISLPYIPRQTVASQPTTHQEIHIGSSLPCRSSEQTHCAQ